VGFLLSASLAAPARADVTRVGEVIVVEGDAETVTSLDGGGRGLGLDNVRAIARKAIGFAGDRFDALTIWTAFDDQGSNAVAYAVSVKNDVMGIGQALMDESADYGSQGVLRNIVNMKSLGLRAGDGRMAWNSALETWGQEAGHRWLAFLLVRDPRTGSASDLLLGRDCAHWHKLVDTQASVFDGYAWIDNKNGTFSWTETSKRYGDLDLYAMGLIDADDVRPFFYLADVPGYDRPSCSQYARVPPPAARTLTATRVDLTMDDVLAINGRRVHLGSSPEDYVREAEIVVTAPGDPASGAVPQALAKRLDQARLWWQEWAHEASGGRLVVCTQSTSDCGDARADVAAIRPVAEDAAAAARGPTSFEIDLANVGVRAAAGVSLALEAKIGGRAFTSPAPVSVGALAPGERRTVRTAVDLTSVPCGTEAAVKATSTSDTHTASRRVRVLVGTEAHAADDFEGDDAWSVDPDGDDSSTGARWQRGTPAHNELLGVVVQPGGARSGRQAWATGVGGGGGSSTYVRGGKTTLQSPPLRLGGASGPLLLYWVSFAGVRGTGLAQTLETSEASRLVVLGRVLTTDALDAGAAAGPWVEVDRLQGEITGGWVERVVTLPAAFDGSDRVQLRFVAEDDNPLQGAVVAAIDDVELVAKLPVCAHEPPPGPADAGADARASVTTGGDGGGCGCRVGRGDPARGSGAGVALAGVAFLAVAGRRRRQSSPRGMKRTL
jgi:MYXO-CTERM domain-containing protein